MEHATSKNLVCLGKSLKPPMSQSKTKKTPSLNVTISCLQTDQLSPSILSKGKLELEGIQLELTFNSASCKTQIDPP